MKAKLNIFESKKVFRYNNYTVFENQSETHNKNLLLKF
jgi:hypothetical protein